MASENATEWADLTVEHLERLDGEAFEELCTELVRLEHTDRHDDARMAGPAPRHTPDEERDILLAVRRPPLQSRVDYQRRLHVTPLTEDHVGRTAYSCKTGDWFELAMRDVERERTDAYRPLEVLAEGGHFKLLINQRGGLDARRKRRGVSRTPVEHLSAALWEKLKAVDPAAPDPSARVDILDADALVAFLRGGERVQSLLVLSHFLPFSLLGPVADVLAWVGDDAGRALQVTQLLRASDDVRDPAL